MSFQQALTGVIPGISIQSLRCVFWLSAVSVLTACGSMQTKDSQQTDMPAETPDQKPVVIESPESLQNTNKIQHSIGNPAVIELWQQAEQARKLGDYDTAVQQLERALRLEPENPIMWSRLAEVQLTQGNANQAESLAAKSNAITFDNPLLNYRNWLIIARARALRGDELGAQEANYTAESFKP